ncbi:MAG: TRAP transporter small permease [Arenicellaceae bacterium]|nr:TRAP transporter small permease [Arenicellaceae bacterium]
MLERWNKLEEILIGSLLAIMVIITCLQVVLRYVFDSGIVWGLEATSYAFLWMVLLGLSYGVRTNSHIAVDALVTWLPSKSKRLLLLVSVTLGLIYTLTMLYGTYIYIERLYLLEIHAQNIPVPKWILSSGLPLGFFLLFLRLLELAKQIYGGQKKSIGAGNEQVTLMGTDE